MRHLSLFLLRNHAVILPRLKRDWGERETLKLNSEPWCQMYRGDLAVQDYLTSRFLQSSSIYFFYTKKNNWCYNPDGEKKATVESTHSPPHYYRLATMLCISQKVSLPEVVLVEVLRATSHHQRHPISKSIYFYFINIFSHRNFFSVFVRKSKNTNNCKVNS